MIDGLTYAALLVIAWLFAVMDVQGESDDNKKDLHMTTLNGCPVGLFVSDFGDLCLKTEYGSNEGRIDAYIVSSGEFFWGDAPQTIANQRKQLVRPVTDEEVEGFLKSIRDSEG